MPTPEELANKAKDLTGGLVDKAKDLMPEGLVDKAEGLIDKAVDALPDGIEDKVSGLIDKAKGIADNLKK